MGMSSVAGIAKSYFDSLRSARDGKLKPVVLIEQFFLPLTCGIAAAFMYFDAPDSEELVTGVSVVAALMCSVATLLFQTRVDLRQRLESGSDAFLTTGDLELVDELFAQVMWSILSGFALVFLLMMRGIAVGTIGDIDVLVRLGFGLVWYLIVNFVLTVCMVLKRIQRVYEVVAVHRRNRE